MIAFAVRLLYITLTSLLAPPLFLGFLWRCLRDRGGGHHPLERFGFITPGKDRSLWVHAVSVGEVRAAAPVIERLKATWPDLEIVLTTTTLTGARQARALCGGQVRHGYLPFDLPGAVRRFLDRVRPVAGIIMETELWPVLYGECSRRGIPLVVASARLSQRSVHRYRRLSGLLRAVFAGDVTVGAQSALDAERFVAIGAVPSRVQVTGNVKFDLAVPDAVITTGAELRASFGQVRPVWVAGSTREGEEALLLDAHGLLCTTMPDALLVLVPRHPQRFAAVEALLQSRGEPYVTRSGGAAAAPGTRVLLVDTLGELLAFYAAADVAFVGGTLVPVGGHNLLEPAALGLPVLAGPHVFNAPDVARLLTEAGGAIEVRDAAETATALRALLADAGARVRRGEAARRVVEGNRGAVEKVLGLVEAALERRGREARKPEAEEAGRP